MNPCWRSSGVPFVMGGSPGASAGNPRARSSAAGRRSLASRLAGSRTRRERLAPRGSGGLHAGSARCRTARRTPGRGRSGAGATGRGTRGRAPRHGSLGGDLLRTGGRRTPSRRRDPHLLLLPHGFGRPLRGRPDPRLGAASRLTGDSTAPLARRASARGSRRFAAGGGTARLRSGPLLRLVSYGHSPCLLWRE